MANLQPLIIILSFGAFILLKSSRTYAVAVTEGEQIALESSGELLPPEDLASMITEDLAAIRSKFPDVANITHPGDFIPGELKVELEESEGFKILEAINATEFGPCEARKVDEDKWTTEFILAFKKPYHPIKLLKALGTKLNAWPNEDVENSTYRIYLSDTPADTGENTYEFKKAWKASASVCRQDRTFCGWITCNYRHFWKFAVGPESNPVELVEEGGNKLTAGITSSGECEHKKRKEKSVK